MLALGLIVVTVLVVNGLGGVGPAFSEIESSHWAWRAPGETTIEVLNRWAIPILGSITAQELISRIVACRSPQVAQRAAWMASLTYLSVGVLPVALGLMATQVNLNVVDAEHVLPELAATHLPTFGYVLFVGALVSAILSTVNSCLLVAGSMISHNLVVPHLPSITERGKLLAARIGVMGSGLAAWYLALSSNSVLGLVEEASGFGSAGILVLMLFALWSPFRRRAGGDVRARQRRRRVGGCALRVRLGPTTWPRSAQRLARLLVGMMEHPAEAQPVFRVAQIATIPCPRLNTPHVTKPRRHDAPTSGLVAFVALAGAVALAFLLMPRASTRDSGGTGQAATAPARTATDTKALIGRWVHTDHPYVVDIRGVVARRRIGGAVLESTPDQRLVRQDGAS